MTELTDDEKIIKAEIKLFEFFIPPPTLPDDMCTEKAMQARNLHAALIDVLKNGTTEKKKELAQMIAKRRFNI